mmetsp:Transcript_105301/g.224933  ORF Transcript_105301/g.224933 Transcript_105301/m.224933 type:complete len:214 (-) Transcript_105301:1568-2209(-)
MSCRRRRTRRRLRRCCLPACRRHASGRSLAQSHPRCVRLLDHLLAHIIRETIAVQGEVADVLAPQLQEVLLAALVLLQELTALATDHLGAALLTLAFELDGIDFLPAALRRQALLLLELLLHLDLSCFQLLAPVFGDFRYSVGTLNEFLPHLFPHAQTRMPCFFLLLLQHLIDLLFTLGRFPGDISNLCRLLILITCPLANDPKLVLVLPTCL